ncbi:MAG: ParA family protein [Caldilineaceae bacterium]|nr:ParA family protein [Caldilineaceae bacterium]
MAIKIAVSNQKGGSGKTTTTQNLAGALAEHNKTILVVDADPQASLTVGWGIDVSALEQTMYNVVVEHEPLQNILISVRDNIDLAPANIYLSVAELKLAGEYRREDRIKSALADLEKPYDYVLIDCPPSLGLLTINAFSAADSVLIPMSCDYYAMVGVKLLLDSIIRTKNQINPKLDILGVVATRYDRRTAHSKEILEELKNKLEPDVRLFKAVIRETVRFKEAPIEGKTITEYNDAHAGAEDYRDLAREVIGIYG